MYSHIWPCSLEEDKQSQFPGVPKIQKIFCFIIVLILKNHDSINLSFQISYTYKMYWIVCIYSVKVELVSVQWNSALQQKGITLPIPQPQKSTMMYRAVYLKLGTCEISNVWNIKCIEYIFCTIYIVYKWSM